jgi:hypothetical protein
MYPFRGCRSAGNLVVRAVGGGVSSMMRRQLRWILASVVAATGLCVVLVASVANVVTADASVVSSTSGLVPTVPGRLSPSNVGGYYNENLVGPLSLAATVTVPTVKCTNSSTWGTQARLLAVMDGPTVAGGDANAEHGGGVQVGCTALTGTPSYAPVICDPSLSADLTYSDGCDTLADPVAPGDTVKITVDASEGCDQTCGSVVTTVNDVTGDWTETVTGSSQSDFNVFVVVAGDSPLLDFGRASMSDVSLDGAQFGGARANVVDLAGHVLARAGALSKVNQSFTVRWLRSE